MQTLKSCGLLVAVAVGLAIGLTAPGAIAQGDIVEVERVSGAVPVSMNNFSIEVALVVSIEKQAAVGGTTFIKYRLPLVQLQAKFLDSIIGRATLGDRCASDIGAVLEPRRYGLVYVSSSMLRIIFEGDLMQWRCAQVSVPACRTVSKTVQGPLGIKIGVPEVICEANRNALVQLIGTYPLSISLQLTTSRARAFELARRSQLDLDESQRRAAEVLLGQLEARVEGIFESYAGAADAARQRYVRLPAGVGAKGKSYEFSSVSGILYLIVSEELEARDARIPSRVLFSDGVGEANR